MIPDEAIPTLARGLKTGCKRMSKLFSAREALEWQKQRQGRVIFGLEMMYAIAREGKVPVVWVGSRKLFFPETSLEKLLSGQAEAA